MHTEKLNSITVVFLDEGYGDKHRDDRYKSKRYLIRKTSGPWLTHVFISYEASEEAAFGLATEWWAENYPKDIEQSEEVFQERFQAAKEEHLAKGLDEDEANEKAREDASCDMIYTEDGHLMSEEWHFHGPVGRNEVVVLMERLERGY